jgi:hypothetical protein
VINLPTFSDISSLLKYLEANVVINLEKIGEEIKSVLRFNLLNDWYKEHTPQYYDRTNMLIDSISVSKAEKVGNVYQVRIYFDEAKILHVPANKPGFFPSHMNITNGESEYGGMSYGELLPLWLEEGQDSSIHPYVGIHMVQTTEDWIREDNYLRTRMIELLESKGYNIL